MKKLVFFIAFAILSFSSVFASDWFKIGHEDGKDIFVNTNMPSAHELWIKIEYTSESVRQKEKQALDWDNIPYSEMHLMVFNDKYTTIGLKSFVVYGEYGRVLLNSTLDFIDMEPIIPDSKGEEYALIAKCIVKEGANKARERFEYVPYTPEVLCDYLAKLGEGIEIPFETKLEPGFICAIFKSVDDSYITDENKDLLVLMLNEAILGIEGIRNSFVEAFCGMKLYMYGPSKSLSATVANYSQIKKRNEE